MDSAPDSPLQLQPVKVPVVRLNRRVLYVLGAVLAGVFVVGLVALRAQGPRAASHPGPGAGPPGGWGTCSAASLHAQGSRGPAPGAGAPGGAERAHRGAGLRG